MLAAPVDERLLVKSGALVPGSRCVGQQGTVRVSGPSGSLLPSWGGSSSGRLLLQERVKDPRVLMGQELHNIFRVKYLAQGAH
ncbi:hypothetical protein EYF80_043806 [Liparis tanakae]|uniref:Uncharacterized protein n=1 Tax=Liparis tanakae TaxID=230148 RepID=A0A4Z2FXL9_9TELE|nr:hypothetical protein EYF80_043806 [Liparis tanakae]